MKTLFLSVLFLSILIAILLLHGKSKPQPPKFERYQFKDFNVKKIEIKKPDYKKFYNYFNVINNLYIYVTEQDKIKFQNYTGLSEIQFLEGYEKELFLNDSAIFGCIGKLNENTAVLAVRGTMTPTDWYEDFHFGQVDVENYKVSEGFYGVYAGENVKTKQNCYCDSPCKNNWCYTDNNCGKFSLIHSWDYCDPNKKTSMKKQILDWINTHPEVENYMITGHSLGAALATLCAVDVQKKTNKVKEVYLYASPRVGNDKFVEYYDNKLKLKDITFSFKTSGDIVPNMPLAAMPDDLCYSHVGFPHYILNYKLKECKLSNIKNYHVTSAFISEEALNQWKHQIFY